MLFCLRRTLASMLTLETFLTREMESARSELFGLPAISASEQALLAHLKARWQEAERLRDAHSSHPFYGKQAARAKQELGDEMEYWLYCPLLPPATLPPISGASSTA